MDEVERLYLAEVHLADAVREFLGTDVGSYLLGRAQEDMARAKDEMVRVNPFWPGAKRKLARIQQDYRVAESFVQWLSESIQNGSVALAQLEAAQDDE